jgi:hypothetical protein
MHTEAQPRTSRPSFDQLVGVAAIASVPLAALNLFLMFAAVHFDLNAMTHPVTLLRQGAAAATLWRWSMICDALGYYVLVAPAIVLLHARTRRLDALRVDLACAGLLAYCLIGAIGAIGLAEVIPPLMRAYTASGANRFAVETVFNAYSNAVYRGMWNLLEEFVAGVGWIVLASVLVARDRTFGRVTLVLGAAALLDSVASAANLDAIASFGLSIYLVLAPIWACWLGIRFLREPSPLPEYEGVI